MIFLKNNYNKFYLRNTVGKAEQFTLADQMLPEDIAIARYS